MLLRRSVKERSRLKKRGKRNREREKLRNRKCEKLRYRECEKLRSRKSDNLIKNYLKKFWTL
jgi:hypothetical protein